MNKSMKTGVFTNRLGAKHNVKVLSLEEKSTDYPGGGNPFTVDSVDVVIEFDGPVYRHSDSRILKLTGYPRGAEIGFYGNCADSGITSTLVLY